MEIGRARHGAGTSQRGGGRPRRARALHDPDNNGGALPNLLRSFHVLQLVLLGESAVRVEMGVAVSE